MQQDLPAGASNISYDYGGLLLVTGLFLLLGYLFYLMLRYSHRLDQTSYLAQLYSAALSGVERRRLASPPGLGGDSPDVRRQIT